MLSKKDTVVGKVESGREDGKDLKYIVSKQPSVEVVTTESMEKAGWFSL